MGEEGAVFSQFPIFLLLLFLIVNRVLTLFLLLFHDPILVDINKPVKGVSYFRIFS